MCYTLTYIHMHCLGDNDHHCLSLQLASIDNILSFIWQTTFCSIASLPLYYSILLSSLPDLGVRVKSLKRKESGKRLESEAVDLTLSSDTEDVVEMLHEQPVEHLSPPLYKGQPCVAVISSWLWFEFKKLVVKNTYKIISVDLSVVSAST